MGMGAPCGRYRSNKLDKFLYYFDANRCKYTEINSLLEQQHQTGLKILTIGHYLSDDDGHGRSLRSLPFQQILLFQCKSMQIYRNQFFVGTAASDWSKDSNHRTLLLG